MPNLLHRLVLNITLQLKSAQHLAVEITEEMIVKVGVVDKIPLAARILVAPSVALAREVNPFGMTKLVAHEVQVATVHGRSRYKANHLVQGYATIHAIVLVATAEVPIHISVNKTEDDSLVAHESLVVTFAVADGALVGAAVGHLPED